MGKSGPFIKTIPDPIDRGRSDWMLFLAAGLATTDQKVSLLKGGLQSVTLVLDKVNYEMVVRYGRLYIRRAADPSIIRPICITKSCEGIPHLDECCCFACLDQIHTTLDTTERTMVKQIGHARYMEDLVSAPLEPLPLSVARIRSACLVTTLQNKAQLPAQEKKTPDQPLETKAQDQPPNTKAQLPAQEKKTPDQPLETKAQPPAQEKKTPDQPPKTKAQPPAQEKKARARPPPPLGRNSLPLSRKKLAPPAQPHKSLPSTSAIRIVHDEDDDFTTPATFNVTPLRPPSPFRERKRTSHSRREGGSSGSKGKRQKMDDKRSESPPLVVLYDNLPPVVNDEPAPPPLLEEEIRETTVWDQLLASYNTFV